jgi:hypothetical protein
MVKSSVVGEPEPFKLERFFAKVRTLFLLKSLSVIGGHQFQIRSDCWLMVSQFDDLHGLTVRTCRPLPLVRFRLRAAQNE